MSASDDVIATLSSRVSELTKRVAALESDLESAQKRIATYEDYDATIQDALSGALKAAHAIRERAETTAAQILDQAREERRLLLKEIERLRDERDTLQEEIADRRRSGIQQVAPRPLSTDAAASELRAVASEALRGLFQEIVDDMRAQQVTPAAPPAPIPEPPRAPEPRSEPAPRPSAEVKPAAVPEPPTYEYMARVKRASVEAEETLPTAVEDVETATRAEDVETPTRAEDVETPAAGGEKVETPAARAEDVETVAPEPAPATTPPPLEVVRGREFEEMAPPRVETTASTSDIQLVLSPVPSFPRLVEIERQIQGLPMVRTLYVRDFRAGIATLAVALRSAMTPDEFAGMLAGLSEPRMRLLSSARNSLELRIDGTASIA